MEPPAEPLEMLLAQAVAIARRRARVIARTVALDREHEPPGLIGMLHDEIDPAFIRRFHVQLHFPRPQVAQRLRLWARAFPPDAPLHPGVDLNSLAQIDLTGAGIVSAGHTAALIAADAGSEHITQEHLGEAIARQFQREARILAPADLAKFRVGASPVSPSRRRDGLLTAAFPR